MQRASLQDGARGSYRKPRGLRQPENGFILRREEWRPIRGFALYEISSHARVRRRGGNVLAPWLVRGRYPIVTLRRSGESIKCSVLRLFGEAFLNLPANREI